MYTEMYNVEEGRDTCTRPKMLARVIGGVMHLLIFVDRIWTLNMAGDHERCDKLSQTDLR
jgi:hypothetical protein